MERFYRIAGIGIRICDPEGILCLDDGALPPFAEDGVRADYTMTVGTARMLPQPEGTLAFRDPGKWVFRGQTGEQRYLGSVEEDWQKAYLYRRKQGGTLDARILERMSGGSVGTKLVIQALALEHLITEQDGILLHASYILHNGRAILFTAPSGTGKSTQAELWQRLRGAELINGDRAVIRQGSEGLSAWGLPLSGSSRVCKNKTAPLAAIVYLSQAPQTAITRLTGVWAFRRIWEGCSINIWNRQDVERATRTVTAVVSAVPVYHLSCTPDESAVRALEEVLENRR